VTDQDLRQEHITNHPQNLVVIRRHFPRKTAALAGADLHCPDANLGTDSHGVSDPSDEGGTESCASTGVAHAMVTPLTLGSGNDMGGTERRPLAAVSCR
jgi:hypothetical protein